MNIVKLNEEELDWVMRAVDCLRKDIRLDDPEDRESQVILKNIWDKLSAA